MVVSGARGAFAGATVEESAEAEREENRTRSREESGGKKEPVGMVWFVVGGESRGGAVV